MKNTDRDRLMKAAIIEAAAGLSEGGVPIGAVLAEGGRIVGKGRNRRVQDGDPIAHGEMDCMRAAGRQRSYAGMTLYTTLSPCMMCAGTIVQFGIKHVVIGENETFGGNEEFLRERGVRVDLMNSAECKSLMAEFIRQYPDVWLEDIGKD